MPDSQADIDFLGQLYGFAERKAVDGIYSARIKMMTGSGQNAFVLVALGEQADYLEHKFMQAATTDAVKDISQRYGF